VIAVGELELDDIANCCSDGVGDESILWTTNDYRDDLVGATKWVGLFSVSIVQTRTRGHKHTLDARQSVDSPEGRTRKRTCSGSKGDREDERLHCVIANSLSYKKVSLVYRKKS
jgi:hypothetical protein